MNLNEWLIGVLGYWAVGGVEGLHQWEIATAEPYPLEFYSGYLECSASAVAAWRTECSCGQRWLWAVKRTTLGESELYPIEHTVAETNKYMKSIQTNQASLYSIVNYFSFVFHIFPSVILFYCFLLQMPL